MMETDYTCPFCENPTNPTIDGAIWCQACKCNVPRQYVKKAENFREKYFYTHVKYPDVIAVMMKFGVLQSYVPATFLNAWINEVELDKAFLICRYESLENNTKSLEEFVKRDDFHTDLKELDDDVLILAHEKNRANKWFFWFDCDVSDCTIGRFHCLKHDEVIRDFESFCRKALEIPLNSIRGWISWG